MTETTHSTTPTPKRPSSTQWHAFLKRELTGTAEVLTARSQKELKNQLNALRDPIQVLSIVRGAAFGVRIQKSFEFVGNSEVDEITEATH